MKKLGIFLVIALVLSLGGYYFFDKMGGNTPIELEMVDQTPPTLSGKIFVGIPREESLGKTFQEIESLQSLHPGSKIHTIYYREPAGKLDTLEVFVGLDLPFAPEGLESKSFEEGRFILAKVKGNPWVMPGPEKVKAEIAAFAAQNQTTLTGIFIDKIVSESEVHVLAPVR